MGDSKDKGEEKLAKTKLVEKNEKSLKQKLDAVDQEVVKDVTNGFYESRLKIEMGMWEKGKKIGEYRGVNSPVSWRELERQTERDHKSLKRWNDLYEKDPEEEKYLEIAKQKAEEWTLKALTRMEALKEAGEEQLPEPKIELYNIWNFAKRDGNYTEPIFGSQTAELIFNLLYYYTGEGSLVFDIFAGSGLVSDVCQKMKRQCYSTDLTPQRDFIKQLNVIKELPEIEPDFIFLDPPYWKQAEGKYSDESDDLANMPLDKFYNCLDVLFGNLDRAYNSFTLALLIANTQWPNDRKVEPHAFKLFEKLTSHFNFEHHIIVPYSTQQYNGTQVEIAKRNKLIIRLHRYLQIYKK